MVYGQDSPPVPRGLRIQAQCQGVLLAWGRRVAVACEDSRWMVRWAQRGDWECCQQDPDDPDHWVRMAWITTMGGVN